ncbi:MAG: hypothetical protein JSU08_02090 [Acidobacteria bacterium]|nr:hypothetical protein [Acidobacteriota bacterium]
MARTTVLTEAPPEPTVAELDGLIAQLKASWTSRVTVRRQSKDDVGFRDIYVSLDDERIAVLYNGQEVSREVKPGRHRLRVHNTLFWKTIDFELQVGEHASFMVVNRRGFGTYSILAYLIGANILYLTVERESFPGERR